MANEIIENASKKHFYFITVSIEGKLYSIEFDDLITLENLIEKIFNDEVKGHFSFIVNLSY